jgi:quinol monooxygenase YgiN
MICVLASIEVVAGKREEFLTHFRQVVPKVRAEEGCIEYGPMIDIATNLGMQPPPRDNVVVVVEKWESVEALENHLMTPHMAEYRKVVKSLVAGMTLQVLQPA